MPLETPVKLTYFDARGRAEVMRLCMAYGKIDFDDKRVEFKDWMDLKPKTPWGGLPIVEINGRVVGQGMALAVFLAKEAGLYGKDNFEGLLMEEILHAREDLMTAEGKTHFEKDEEKKAEAVKNLMEEIYPSILGRMNTTIKENKTGWAVGAKESLADLVIFEGTQGVSEHQPELLDKYPEIKALRKKVSELDGIKQYLAKRKPTMF